MSISNKHNTVKTNKAATGCNIKLKAPIVDGDHSRSYTYTAVADIDEYRLSLCIRAY